MCESVAGRWDLGIGPHACRRRLSSFVLSLCRVVLLPVAIASVCAIFGIAIGNRLDWNNPIRNVYPKRIRTWNVSETCPKRVRSRLDILDRLEHDTVRSCPIMSGKVVR